MSPIALALLASLSLADERPAPLPGPLAPSKMQLPAAEVGKLSNGIPVRVAPNHEVPLWEVRIVFAVGSYADPVGQEGLAGLTFDMLDEGAGDRDSAAISAELKRLAGSLHASGDAEASTVAASGIKRNLAATLDLWVDAVRRPSFPEAEWSVVRERTLADLRLAAENPGVIARNALRQLLWGDGYVGRHATEQTVTAITPDAVKSFYGQRVGPQNAIVLVGGDVTLAEVLPLLEARLGDWKVDGFVASPSTPTPVTRSAETVYLVDKPGAPQSMLRSWSWIGPLASDDTIDLMVGNEMFGSAFTGRINLNLREDKGYTYGASCYVTHRQGPGQILCATAVRTDATVASLVEMRREMADVVGARPLGDAEIAEAKDALAFGYPGRFETTGPILDLAYESWLYGRAEDWAAQFVPKVRAVTPARANAAMKRWLIPTQVTWLIVGDKATVLPGLQELGVPIVELDRDGRPLAGN